MASALGLTLGACTNVVDNLVTDGHVVRQHDKNDRRVVRTTLTPAGEKKAVKIAETMTSDAARLLGGIAPQERSTFLEVFGKIVEAAEKGAPAPKLHKVG